jgi:hypothetical protein
MEQEAGGFKFMPAAVLTSVARFDEIPLKSIRPSYENKHD